MTAIEQIAQKREHCRGCGSWIRKGSTEEGFPWCNEDCRAKTLEDQILTRRVVAGNVLNPPELATGQRPVLPEEVRRQIGARLRKLRVGCDLTMEMAARRAGVNWSAIGHHEVGRVMPTVTVLMRLVKLYRTTSDYVLFGGGQLRRKDPDA